MMDVGAWEKTFRSLTSVMTPYQNRFSVIGFDILSIRVGLQTYCHIRISANCMMLTNPISLRRESFNSEVEEVEERKSS